jgi:hypothetical protein
VSAVLPSSNNCDSHVIETNTNPAGFAASSVTGSPATAQTATLPAVSTESSFIAATALRCVGLDSKAVVADRRVEAYRRATEAYTSAGSQTEPHVKAAKTYLDASDA